MKILVPVDGSRASLAAVHRLASRRTTAEVLLLNVQPRFHLHIAQFTRRAWRDDLRLERSVAALGPAADLLAAAGVRFRTLMEVGAPDECIAAVSKRERVDHVVGVAPRRPGWLLPAALAGAAALLLAAD